MSRESQLVALGAVLATAVLMTPSDPGPRRTTTSPPRAAETATASLDYRTDEHDDRVVAAVRGTLRRRSGRATLRVAMAAVGASVDPVPGFRGVRGTNLTTAVELEEILREGRASVLIDGEPGGRLVVGRRERLPERRVDGAGRLRLDTVTAEALPAEVLLLADGVERAREVTLLVDGEPRLIARLGDGASTLQLVNPGHPRPGGDHP